MFAPRKNLAAFLLAGLYALIAAFGHTMHSNCCHEHESAASCSHSCCDKIDTTRFASARAALAALRSHSTSKSSQSGDNTDTIAKSCDSEQAHGDCATCQLLSQMAHGFPLDAPHVGAWLNTSFPPVINESLNERASTVLFDARGPPALA